MRRRNPFQQFSPVSLSGVALLIAAAALAGGGLGLVATSDAAALSGCPKKACDREYNTCFNTDIKSSCAGDPCQSELCGVGGEDPPALLDG